MDLGRGEGDLKFAKREKRLMKLTRKPGDYSGRKRYLCEKVSDEIQADEHSKIAFSAK